MHKKKLLLIILVCLIIALGLHASSSKSRRATAMNAVQTEFDCTHVTEIPQTECEALVAIYLSTDGDNWNNNSGWLATNQPCSWFARLVFEMCNIKYCEGNSLNNRLPPEIGDLSSLQHLDLSNNQQTSLPPEIGDLSSLINLYLYNN